MSEQSYVRKHQSVCMQREIDAKGPKTKTRGQQQLLTLFSRKPTSVGRFLPWRSRASPLSVPPSVSVTTEKQPSAKREERTRAAEETNVRLHASGARLCSCSRCLIFCRELPGGSWSVHIWCPAWGPRLGFAYEGCVWPPSRRQRWLRACVCALFVICVPGFSDSSPSVSHAPSDCQTELAEGCLRGTSVYFTRRQDPVTFAFSATILPGRRIQRRLWNTRS